jgi:polygalacturonase
MTDVNADGGGNIFIKEGTYAVSGRMTPKSKVTLR